MQTFIPFHAPALYDRAKKSAHRHEGVSTAVLCHATIEALLNDLTTWLGVAIDHNVSCQREKNEKNIFGHRKNNITCITNLHKITLLETDLHTLLAGAERESTSHKVLLAANKLSNKNWSNGATPLQEFILLEKIRHEIVHTKGNTLTVDGGKISGYPTVVQTLIKSKKIEGPDSFVNWLSLLDSQAFSEFCINSTAALYTSFINLLPDTYMSEEFKHDARLS